MDIQALIDGFRPLPDLTNCSYPNVCFGVLKVMYLVPPPNDPRRVHYVPSGTFEKYNLEPIYDRNIDFSVCYL